MSTPKEFTAEWLIEVALYSSPADGGCTASKKSITARLVSYISIISKTLPR